MTDARNLYRRPQSELRAEKKHLTNSPEISNIPFTRLHP